MTVDVERGTQTNVERGTWNMLQQQPIVSVALIMLAAAAIVAVAGVYLVLLPPLFDWLQPLPQAVRIMVAVALIAPLAFFMGMPFPLGLGVVSERAPALVPWAWGINGCASVMSAVLATVLAIHIGFTGVVAAALLLYALAAAVFGSGRPNPAES